MPTMDIATIPAVSLWNSSAAPNPNTKAKKIVTAHKNNSRTMYARLALKKSIYLFYHRRSQ